MKRVSHPPRLDWQAKVEAQGLLYHTHKGEPYWFEGAHYEISASEVERLERATNDLAMMCLQAVDHVVSRAMWDRMCIPNWVVPAIVKSWEDDVPSVYGRFDLAFDGNRVKLLEYNADTPTSLLEAAVVQWKWLEETEPGTDQFNSVWEGLVAKWATLKTDPGVDLVTFACDDVVEDLMTVTVLRDTAQEAGLETQQLWLADIGWDAVSRRFVDLQDRPIDYLFKLHPWEEMVKEPFGAQAVSTYGATQWIEPAWKMVLSNKAVLPLLWELFPGHDLLAPAYADGPRDMSSYVKKPLFSREGANVTIVSRGVTLEASAGEYGDEGFVFQELVELPEFDAMHPVVGSWVIDHEARGIGIRETAGRITDDFARFVPHLLRP